MNWICLVRISVYTADEKSGYALSELWGRLTVPSIDEELLTPAGMAATYEALTGKYPWLMHVKPVRKFELIKKEGLQPRSQGCPTNPTVATALQDSVRNVDEMIFLRPVGTDDSTPRRGEKMFTMAVTREAVPKILTVDWTFSGTWGLAQIIKNYTPDLKVEDVFCEVVRRRGSVAIYEALPRGLLRVRTKCQPADDPSNWPRLVDTDIADVEQFD
jgi:hypothetical protein